MIKLTGINKIYRTNEIETVALENVNLEVNANAINFFILNSCLGLNYIVRYKFIARTMPNRDCSLFF